jgi:membrane associated rhomboid family serine protease
VNQPPQPQPSQQAALPGCWWHPNRQTGLSCARCGRPACPDCLRDAAVGFQCIDCVQTGQKQQKVQRKQHDQAGLTSRTIVGAKYSQRAVVTPVLIALNVLVYLVTAVQAKSPMENQHAQLFIDGVLFSPSIAFDGEWWRLFISGFLHYGLIHLAVNMFSLWMLGKDLELLLGKARFTAVYLLSLLGGSISVFVFDDPGRPTAGASGAIYGLLGAILIVILKLKMNPTQVIGVIALNLVISVSIPNISLLGHLGGFVIGAVAMAALVFAPLKNRAAWQTGTLVVLTVALIGMFALRDNRLEQETCGIKGNDYVCVDTPSGGQPT